MIFIFIALSRPVSDKFAVHLPRYLCKSVAGVFLCLPPGTESPRKRSRWHLPASHLARNSCESVPGVLSCRPPATESPRKCSRCHFLPSTWHGIPAKVFQVSLPASHLPRYSCESVPGGISLLSTCHSIPAKVFQVASFRRPPGTEFQRKCSRCLFSAFHLARFSSESIPGVFPRLPPATVFQRKCSRCLFPLPTWHGSSSHHGISGLFSRRNE